ncbi:TT1751-like protein [Schizophyllum commune H4-8]|uniref:TT1751-like protein n=1 Tax=Schizophyllum commune (strain H4-8 / FGSC 9210) TaxID=578458 RepID=UPI00215E460F|nr:TT1751-like protein [Schizophyllum commune H4-8]KAI5893846.1 TT1751-like protein [Schizophyllum commune H4-8]
MTSTVTPFECRLVTYETSMSFDEVITRLNDAINREGSPSILSNVWRATNKDTIDDLLPSNGFIFFNEFPHHKWLNPYHGVSNTPRTSVYVIGNPRFADSMLKHDLRAALHIPPRLLVLEKADRSGTSVQYHLPSSDIALPGSSAALREGAEMLDAKFEALVKRITHE